MFLRGLGGAGQLDRRNGRDGWRVAGRKRDGKVATEDSGGGFLEEVPVFVLQPLDVEFARCLDQEFAVGESNCSGSSKPSAEGLLRETGLDHLENARPEFGGRELHGRQCWVKKALNWGQASYSADVEKSICSGCGMDEAKAKHGFWG